MRSGDIDHIAALLLSPAGSERPRKRRDVPGRPTQVTIRINCIEDEGSVRLIAEVHQRVLSGASTVVNDPNGPCEAPSISLHRMKLRKSYYRLWTWGLSWGRFCAETVAT